MKLVLVVGEFADQGEDGSDIYTWSVTKYSRGRYRKMCWGGRYLLDERVGPRWMPLELEGGFFSGENWTATGDDQPMSGKHAEFSSGFWSQLLCDCGPYLET